MRASPSTATCASLISPDASDVPLKTAALLRDAGEIFIDLQQRGRDAEQQYVVALAAL